MTTARSSITDRRRVTRHVRTLCSVLILLALLPSAAPARAAGTLAPPAPATVDATGQITGLVTGPDGTTMLSGIRVTAYRQTGASTWSIAGTGTTSSSGVYSIGSLVTGVYRAKFESLTGAYVTEFYDNKSTFNLATNFNVTDGQTTPIINASMAQAGSIAGRVTDLVSGSGVGDIVVTAWIDESGVWRQASSALTASNGNYTLSGLAGGLAYRIKFSDGLAPPRFLDEYYDNVATIGAATPVNVTGGQTTTNINAAMGSYGKITGTVTGPNGTTVAANIDVDVYQFNSTLGQWEWVSGDSTTSAGVYEATGLETRNYRLFFSDPTSFFVAEYYNNKPDLLTADDVLVQLGLTTAGINASMAPPCYFADVQPSAVHGNPPLCDYDVDIADVERVARCWMQPVGAACPATLDFDQSGTIDSLDLSTVAGEWGWPNF